MKSIVILLVEFIGLVASVYAQIPQRLPLNRPTARFIENKNQWSSDIRFCAALGNGFIFVRAQSLVYGYFDPEPLHCNHGTAAKAYPKYANAQHLTRAHNVVAHFEGANPQSSIKSEGQSTEYYNYLLGNDPTRWAREVRAYQSLTWQSLYKDIDLVLLQTEASYKYEFHVGAGADAQQIRIRYEGADTLYLRAGNLVMQTSLGNIEEKAPYCYQVRAGQRIPVPSRFNLHHNTLTFEFPAGYDTTLPLVIDPELVFSSYSGAGADNWGSTATYDAAGNLYGGGIIRNVGAGFPTTPGAFQLNFAGLNDVGVMKFNLTGGLVYATYLGGSSSEFPHSLVVNAQNELFIYGTTSSNNFPTTPNAFDNSFNGGTSFTPISGIEYPNGSDIFLTRLNATGTNLVGSTYIGGSANDGINFQTPSAPFTTFQNYGDQFRGEITLDAQGHVYLASTTRSTNFPLQNAAQTTLSGVQDGVLMKIHSGLNLLFWSTYFGGSNFDVAYGIALNALNEVYVCGVTRSLDLRTARVPVANQNTAYLNFNTGDDEGYVARLSNAGAIIQITFIGTPNADQTFLLDFDSEGAVYVLGQTTGIYPVSVGVYTNNNGGQFIHKLSPDLAQSLLSTRLGRGDGNPDISPTAFMVNECGNIYLAGWGSNILGIGSFNLTTDGLPVTSDAFRSTTDGNDFYIMILEKNLQSLLYATFFGGTQTNDHVDGGTSRFDKNGGVIYHAACASCGGVLNDFPTTSGAFAKQNSSSNCNMGVFKIDIGSLDGQFDIFDPITDIQITQSCQFPVNVRLRAKGVNVRTYTWRINGVQVSTQQEFVFALNQFGTYTIELTLGNPVSCLKSKTISKTFRVSQIAINTISTEQTICFGQSARLEVNVNSSIPFTYQWSPTTGLDNPNSPSPIASPTTTTTYTLRVTDAFGCFAERTVTVKVIPPLPPGFLIANNANIILDRTCTPAVLSLSYDTTGRQVSSFVWEISGVGTFANQTPLNITLNQAGSYSIKLSATRTGQCPETQSLERQLLVEDLKAIVSPTARLCVGESTNLSVQSNFSNITITWSPATGLNNPNIANPIATPTQTTRYRVRVQSTEGCVAENEVLVEVFPRVRLDFDLALASECGKPTQLRITNRSQGATDYTWQIGTVGTLTGASPDVFLFPEDFAGGEIPVQVIGTNGECTAQEVRLLRVENNASRLPNALTPNGDGKNETWDIGLARKGYRLEIHDRWGKILYRSDNYANDWGAGVDAGTYYYILISPEGIICRGWIQVMK